MYAAVAAVRVILSACNLKVTMERRSVDSSQSRVAVILECNGFKELKLSRHIDY